MTDIFAWHHHRLDSRKGNKEMKFTFQNVWTEGTVFIHKAVTQKAFVNTEVIYSKPQSNKSVPERFDGYGVEICF